MHPIHKTLVVFIFLAATVSAASAAPAHLDPDFGGDGRGVVPLSGADRPVAAETNYTVDSAGRVLALGTTPEELPLVFRYLPDGGLDQDFGDGGVVTIGHQARAEDVAVDSQGRIVVAGDGWQGEEEGNFSFLARLLDDGRLDPGFGDGGLLVVRRPRAARAVAVDGLDRIVVAGIGANAADARGVAARYNPDGSEDVGFRGPEEIGSTVDDLIIDSAGRILLAGRSRLTPSSSAPQVRRLLPDGSMDPGFGEGGQALLPSGHFARNGRGAVGAVSATGLAVDSRGRILLTLSTGGPEMNSRGSGFAAMRLRANGAPGRAFGKRGRVLYAMTRHAERESSVSLGVFVDERDRPEIGGTVAAGSRQRHPAVFGLIRLRLDGGPDPSFAPRGRLRLPFGRISAKGGEPMPIGKGRILLAGKGERGERQFGLIAVVRAR